MSHEKQAGSPFPGPSSLELWVTFPGPDYQGFSKCSPLDGPSGVSVLHKDLEFSCNLTYKEKKMKVTALEYTAELGSTSVSVETTFCK